MIARVVNESSTNGSLGSEDGVGCSTSSEVSKRPSSVPRYQLKTQYLEAHETNLGSHERCPEA